MQKLRVSFLNKLTDRQKVITGAFFMSLFGFLGVILTISGKHLKNSMGYDPVLLMSMRYFLLFFLFLPIMIYRKFSFLKNFSYLKTNILKDSLSALATLIWYKSTVFVPTNNAITIAFLNPVFVIIIDSIVSKKPIAFRVSVGLICSFIGILLTIGFDLTSLSKSFIPYLLIIIVSLMRSLSAIVTRRSVNSQGVKDSFYSGIFVQFIVVLTVLLFNNSISLQSFTFDLCKSALLISLIFGAYYLSYLIAIRMADLSWLQPFMFLRIIFSAILSYFIFGEKLGVFSIIGAILVVFGVYYATKPNNNALKAK